MMSVIDFTALTFEEKKRIVLDIILTRFDELSASTISKMVFIHKTDYKKTCDKLTGKKSHKEISEIVMNAMRDVEIEDFASRSHFFS